MSELLKFVSALMGAVVRVALWALTAVLALFLLGLALVLLLLGVLWALLRGRKPTAPVLVGRFQRFTTERVWPGRPGWGRPPGATTVTEVVDVEVREVDETVEKIKGPEQK